MMLPRKDTSAVALSLLLALSFAPESLAASTRLNTLLLGNAPTFQYPNSVPNGTKLTITNTPAMSGVSQALKQQFEKQFQGTAVTLQDSTPEEALKAVMEGKTDLAAVRRPLTAEEKAQGLVSVPVNREKIAIVIGADNPFQGELTNEEFAGIFRGEITDWSSLKRDAGAIRMLDRPEGSDLRLAFREYPVFQNFSSGANVVRLPEDTTEELIKQLGNDGIGYAPVSQVANNPAVKILAMYGTLPTDPKYPFSQAFSYVYKGPNPNPAVQAFLGYASAPQNQPMIEEAKKAGIVQADAQATPVAEKSPEVSPSPATSPTTSPTTVASPSASPTASASASPGAGSPASPGATGGTTTAQAPGGAIADSPQGPWSWLWWLLPLGLIGLLFAWLLKGGQDEEEYVDDVELSSGGPDVDPNELAGDRLDRSDLELPDFGTGAAVATGAGFATGAAAAVQSALSGTASPASRTSGDRLVGDVAGDIDLRLTPRNARNAYASWEASEEQKAAVRAEGGELYALRLYDVTGLDAPPADEPMNVSYEQFECDEVAQDWHVSIPQGDRDYLVELGYVTQDGRWLKIGRSAPTYVPPETGLGRGATDTVPDSDRTETWSSRNDTTDDATGNATTETTDDTIVQSFSAPPTAPPAPPIAPPPVPPTSPPAPGAVNPGAVNRSSITLEARNPQQAHVTWDVPMEYRDAIRQKGGEKMAIRLYDVTDIDVKSQPPHSVRQFTCNESTQEQFLPVPMSDRDYIAEIGYVMNNGRWVRLCRSVKAHVPKNVN
jgi:phosphate transport system substrate-binding protein